MREREKEKIPNRESAKSRLDSFNGTLARDVFSGYNN